MKRLARKAFERFVELESFSGILLFGAAIIALLWANSPYGDSYASLWEYKIGVASSEFRLVKPLILWINDGLMAIFFFLIGLEIKRELLIGELDSFKKATLPLFAAAGGMFVPLGLFLLLNRDPGTVDGWGISMATDIAFSLAILKLLGKRVPLSLKVFLTAFAIVDDLGAVLVIAIFYSTSIKWLLILYSLLLLAVPAILARRGIYIKYVTLFFGVAIWVLFLKAGIHPTIAGVLLAFTVPVRQKVSWEDFIAKISGLFGEARTVSGQKDGVLSPEQLDLVEEFEEAADKVHSPLQYVEHKLHYWVAYFIIPVFAFSNAGVSLATEATLNTSLILNIALALFLGKGMGVTLLVYLGVRLKLTELPDDMHFLHVIGVAILAGVGFTMSIFIANLAFPDSAGLIASAKIGILLGSLVSGGVGYAILRYSSGKPVDADE